ncbi:hypothetical protein F5Y12DRAFT_756043 [Xylaria sp. FL1777]|nr:hypothetical protein F5Y12DRAFT_756043 [Xylaria sp. FL1777]
MAEGGVDLGMKILTRWYDKAKNYKGDIQSSNARLKQLRETLNDSRKYLDQFPSEYTESSVADWKEYIRKGTRVLRKETANLEEDRARGRTRFVLKPGAREHRSRSNSRVSEEIARIERRETSHRKRADARERLGRSSQRDVALPDPGYYGQADRDYGGNHYRRGQPEDASGPNQTHQIRHQRLEAWLDEQDNVPTAETSNDYYKQRHNYVRSIEQPSSVIPPYRVVVNRTYPAITGQETVQPRERIARREPYYEYPRQETWGMTTNWPQKDAVIARERITVYSRDRRGHARMIETYERVTRRARREIREIPERVSRAWSKPMGTRTIILD